MRTVSPVPKCAVTNDALMRTCFPEWWGARHSERMGNTPTSTSAAPPHHQGQLQGRRSPPLPPRPAGQPPGLRRPVQLPAGPAGGRLEHPPARHPPGHHPTGDPPRHHRPRPAPAVPPRAPRAPAPARRPAARHPPRRRARLPQRAGLSGGPAGHPGMDLRGGGGRAWRRARHPAPPTGRAASPAGGPDAAAARRRRGRQRPRPAGAGNPAPPGPPGRTRL